PAGLARVWDEHTERCVAPFYRNQVAADRARIAEMAALRDGLPPPPRNSMMDRFVRAAGQDAVVFRALLETVLCLALPQQVLRRPASGSGSTRWRTVLRCGYQDLPGNSYSGCSAPNPTGALTRRRSRYR